MHESNAGGASTPTQVLGDSGQLESVAAEYERLVQRANKADVLGTVRRFEAAQVAHGAAERLGKKKPVVEALVARTGRAKSWIYEELRLARIFRLEDVKSLQRPWTHLQAVVRPSMKLRGIRSLSADNESMVREEALGWLEDGSLSTVEALRKAIEEEAERREAARRPEPDPEEEAEALRQDEIRRLVELLIEAQPLAKSLLSSLYTDDHRAQFRVAVSKGHPFELSGLLLRLVGEDAEDVAAEDVAAEDFAAEDFAAAGVLS